MMKFAEHPDHNRNISVTFADSWNTVAIHGKGLPKEIVIQVKYLDGGPCGDASKALRLDNEVMHLLKAAPRLLEAGERLRVASAAVGNMDHAGIPVPAQAWAEMYAANCELAAAIAEASKSTY